MRTLIFGAGAVGGYLGAKLLQAGWPVTFFGREDTTRSLRSGGLVLKEPGSSHTFNQIEAYHQWPPRFDTKPDLILLTVKAYDCESAAKQIRDAGWNTPVVSFLNGVGSEAMLAEILPTGTDIIAATLTTAVERPAPTTIEVAKERGVGLQEAVQPTNQLALAFSRAGIEVKRYSDPQSMKWSKLLSNLFGNASAALTGLTVSQIYSHPGLFRLELAMLREAHRVMAAAGIAARNLPGIPIRWLTVALRLPAWLLQPILLRMVAGGRGGKRPSMYYDVSRGRTEVDWLNGAVVQLGNSNDIATPANRLLTESVHHLSPGDRLRPRVLLNRAAAAGLHDLAVYNRPGS